MRNFILRLFINALALWAAARFIDGVDLAGSLTDILWVALVFGVVNALVKPVIMVLSLPVLFVTLGLFTLVINGGLLLLTDALTDALTVSGWVPAILGSVVVSLVSIVLTAFLKDSKDD